MLQRVAEYCSVLHPNGFSCRGLQRVAVRCRVMQCVAVCCSVLQRVAVYCSVLQWQSSYVCCVLLNRASPCIPIGLLSESYRVIMCHELIIADDDPIVRDTSSIGS